MSALAFSVAPVGRFRVRYQGYFHRASDDVARQKMTQRRQSGQVSVGVLL